MWLSQGLSDGRYCWSTTWAETETSLQLLYGLQWKDNHDHLRFNYNNFGDPLNTHLVPPAGESL